MMMSLAATLASLGLLQGSGAVIIGAMIVAPLMGPLVAAGLALVQGNARLMRQGAGLGLAGIGVAFLISVFRGLVNPGYEPSMEIEARGNPDIIDLGIAFASGMAAAYAMGSPRVAATLAGVAIAAALVPPLTVIGIALTNGRSHIAGNASVLLVTNLVCIILGAAMVFRLFGVQASLGESKTPIWVRRALAILACAAILLSAPLVLSVFDVHREGQARPLSYPVGTVVRDAVDDYLTRWPGVQLIAIARNGVEPEAGITVLIATDEKLPEPFDDELIDVIQTAHREMPIVRVGAGAGKVGGYKKLPAAARTLRPGALLNGCGINRAGWRRARRPSCAARDSRG